MCVCVVGGVAGMDEVAGPSAGGGEDNLDQLRETIRQLSMERDRLALRAAGAAAITEVPYDTATLGPATTRVVHIARERPCPKFSGNGAEDPLEVDEWIEEVRRCWEGRDLSQAEQVIFIRDHLTGNARAELEFHPPGVRAHPDQVFSLLVEHFKCPKSYVTTLAQFYQRHQRAGESAREYSYALKRLMDLVGRKIPGGLADSDRLLRDQYVVHLRDAALRRALDQRVAVTPSLTFGEARAFAVQWEGSRPPVGTEGRVAAPPQDVEAASCRVETPPAAASGPPPSPAALRELTELVQHLGRLVERLVEGGAGGRSPAPKAGPRHSRVPDGERACFRCGAPGHIARWCPAPSPPAKQNPPSAAATRAVEATAPVAAGNDPPLV